MPDWFEYRGKCSVCGYMDKQANFPTHRFNISRPPVEICPKCRSVWIERMYESGLRHKVSVIFGYAVHAECGKWHKEGTECKGE